MDQDDVLRFDVSVEDFLLMDVTDGIQKISDNKRSGFFRKSLAIFDDIVELASFPELQNGVKVILVVEEAINPGDIGML
jgi:hypothetical protein